MQIYIETSHTAKSGARSGIQTVVRGLIEGLSSHGCAVHPVRWSFKNQALTTLKPRWERNLVHTKKQTPASRNLSALDWMLRSLCARIPAIDYKFPLHRHPLHSRNLNGSWLIMPELMEGYHVHLAANYARRQGMRVAGIFHDAIPWLHPELVLHWTNIKHAEYMAQFAELDVVIPVSMLSAQHFSDFVELQGLPMPVARVCNLAVEVLGEEREMQFKKTSGDTVKLLCVSTLEPRKNHDLLIEAFEKASASLGSVRIELHLVGDVYPAAPGIAKRVERATENNPSIFWHGKAEPGILRNLYRDCDFTVFASSIEGFGLPVMESLWFGKPCICSDTGVMAENAKDGGCLTVDVRDLNALTDAIIKLSSRPELRRELSEQAMKRKLKSWGEYSEDIQQILTSL